MQNTAFTQAYQPFPIDRTAVLRYAGARESTPELDALLDECLAEANGIFSGTVCYRETPVHRENDTVDLTFTKVSSKALARNLDGCDRAVIFAATVGLGIDRLVMFMTGADCIRDVILFPQMKQEASN